MRERINRLARGILTAETPELSVSPESLDGEVRSGEVLRTSVSADSENGVHLKGLVYSDDPRVQVLRASYGGVRNRIAVEVDARDLDPGEELTGTLRFVTNGGECQIPFCFRVTAGAAAGILGRLTSIKNFAYIAKADPESALRIFCYRDFVRAPFMQDLRLRALYDAFRSGADRASAMEQFLVASGAKQSALVRAETPRLEFRDLTEDTEGSITLAVVRPGYCFLSVKAEGAFIRLTEQSVPAEALRGGSAVFRFSIDVSRLHEGRNDGKIRFIAGAFRFSVPVTVFREKAAETEAVVRNHLACRRSFAEYLALRVEAALAYGWDEKSAFGCIPEDIARQMSGLLESSEPAGSLSHRTVLLMAEAAMLGGMEARARELLAGVMPEVIAVREQELFEYLLCELLQAMLPGGESRKEGAARLLRKFMEEKGMHELITGYLMLRPDLRRNPAELDELLRAEYDAGSRSPFLYAETVKLYEAFPQLIRALGPAELSVLRFSLRHSGADVSGRYSDGLKNGKRGKGGKDEGALPGEEAAAAYTAAAGTVRTFSRMHFRLLAALYTVRPSRELLTQVCTVLIRQDIRTSEAGKWYLRGIEEKIRLNGLYEYLIYSMPEQDSERLPHEVLLYFAYDSRLDSRSKAKLYENICRFRDKEPELWAEYRRQIEEFTLNELLAGHISRNLAVLYRAVLIGDMVDRRLAAALPAVLNARSIRTDAPYVRSAVIVYPELREAAKITLKDGQCVTPVYTEDALVLFEDAYGNRYSDVPFRADLICSMPEMAARCAEVNPDSAVQLLGQLKKVLEKYRPSDGSLTDEELTTLHHALNALPLSSACREKICHLMMLRPGDCADLLLQTDLRSYSSAERSGLLKGLCDRERFAEAWEILKEFVPVRPDLKVLKAVCSKMILDRMFPQDRLLLSWSARLFRTGNADAAILDYLCESWNDSTENMYRLLDESARRGIGTGDLEERLMAQMLFTGNTEHLDEVFERYRTDRKSTEVMVRAYITDRSAEYFLHGKMPDAGVFRYLEMLFADTADRKRVPEIYKLALTRYYAGLDSLTEEQAALAEEILYGLLDEGLCFPYYKNLARFIPVPEDVLDKAILEFRGKADGEYEIRSRILPGEEAFRPEKLERMYQDLYVKRQVLFAGETWEYEVTDLSRPEAGVIAKGSVQSEIPENADEVRQVSRFACINRMTALMNAKDEAGLRREMQSFAAQEDLAAELFRPL